VKVRIWHRIAFAVVVLAIMNFSAAAVGQNLLIETTPGAQEDNLAEVSAVFSRTSAQPGNDYPAALIVEVAPHWHINSATPYQDWLIPARLTCDTIEGIVPYGIIYPKGVDIPLMGEQMLVYDGSLLIFFKVAVGKDAPVGEAILPLSFTYQACNDKECRAPQTIGVDLPVMIGQDGNPINTNIFGSIKAESGDTGSLSKMLSQESDLELLIEKYGFWGYFLALGIAFITGVLLSFSPCTYPMIPITVSVFAGQKRSIGKGFILSLFYVGSMAIMYGVMGLIVSLIGGVFGAWLASPPVVIAIAVVFVLFSLSMFGLYELNVPSSIRQKLGTTKTGSGISGSIILGIIAALVVSPCVGPFVAGILLYIATYGSPIFGFVTLFVFALGLGTLYIIIGTFSSAISALPGAGTWMESVKKFFGFVLLMMALYFLRTILPPALTNALAGLLLIAFAVFGGGFDRLTPESKFFARLKKFLGMVAFLAGMYLLLSTMLIHGFVSPPWAKWYPSMDSTSIGIESPLIDWETDMEEGLARALSEKKPVLIDTWATWCANCRIMDKKTFRNLDVAGEAKRFIPLRIQLETASSPITRSFMTRFGLTHYSLPTTLLLDSTGQVQQILQGLVGPEKMLEEMRKIR